MKCWFALQAIQTTTQSSVISFSNTFHFAIKIQLLSLSLFYFSRLLAVNRSHSTQYDICSLAESNARLYLSERASERVKERERESTKNNNNENNERLSSSSPPSIHSAKAGHLSVLVFPTSLAQHMLMLIICELFSRCY